MKLQLLATGTIENLPPTQVLLQQWKSMIKDEKHMYHQLSHLEHKRNAALAIENVFFQHDLWIGTFDADSRNITVSPIAKNKLPYTSISHVLFTKMFRLLRPPVSDIPLTPNK